MCYRELPQSCSIWLHGWIGSFDVEGSIHPFNLIPDWLQPWRRHRRRFTETSLGIRCRSFWRQGQATSTTSVDTRDVETPFGLNRCGISNRIKAETNFIPNGKEVFGICVVQVRICIKFRTTAIRVFWWKFNQKQTTLGCNGENKFQTIQTYSWIWRYRIWRNLGWPFLRLPRRH